MVGGGRVVHARVSMVGPADESRRFKIQAEGRGQTLCKRKEIRSALHQRKMTLLCVVTDFKLPLD